MFWRTLLAGGLMLLFLTPGQAERPISYRYQHYTSVDGLAFSKLNCSLQDQRGFLWIGTTSGLSCFDGVNFRNYGLKEGLPTVFVGALAENQLDSSIWVGTSGGLVRITAHDLQVFDQEQGLPARTVITTLVTRDGTVYAGTHNGLSRLENGRFQTLTTENGLPGNVVRHLIELSDGTLLIGTNKGLATLKNGIIQPRLSEQFSQTVFDLFLDQEDKIWLVTMHNRIFRGDLGGFEEVKFPGQDTVNWCSAITQTPDGRLFLIHPNQVSVFRHGRFEQSINDVFPRGINTFTSGMADRENNLWLLSVKGLYRAWPGFTEFYGCHPQPCATDVESIAVGPDGEVLIGSNSGAVRRAEDGQLITAHSEKPPQMGEILGLAYDHAGNLWVQASLDRMVRWNGQDYTTYSKSDGLPTLIWYSLYSSPDGRLWAGTRHHLVEWTGTTWVERAKEAFQGRNILSLCQGDDGTLWVGTNAGIYSYRTAVSGEEQVENKSKGLSSEFSVIRAVKWRDGQLFAASSGQGVLVYEPEADGSLQLIRQIDTDNGLASNSVHDLCFDPDGNLWMGTGAGLYGLQFGATPTEDRLVHYDARDGIVGTAWTNTIMQLAPNGDLLLGNGQGLTRIDLHGLFENTRPPEVYLTGVELLDDASHPVKGAWELPSGVSLAHDQNQLTLHFSAIHFAGPEKLRFRHRLVGLDASWSAFGKARKAVYYSLPPGQYTFEVEAINEQGIINTTPASWQFVVLPPFWQTWWFRVLAIVVLVGVVYGIYRWRVTRILAREQEKQQVEQELSLTRQQAFRAQTNPHFVFNALSSIQHFIAENDRTAALSYLTKFSRLLRGMLEQSREPLVTLERELQLLKHYIEIEQLRFEERFDYAIDVDPALHPADIQLPGMLLQPLVENAIKHGLLPKNGSGSLQIVAKPEAEHLLVTVVDNGIGREAAKKLADQRQEKHSGLGLQVTRDLLHTLTGRSGGASLQFTDLYHADGSPAGTQASLKIPLNLTA